MSHINKVKTTSKIMRKLVIPIIIGLFLISILSFSSAFQLEKHLVQTSVDENYPCHIENSDTIVCPPLDNQKINDWKDKIDNLKEEDKNQGKYTDTQKKNYILNRVTAYSGKTDKWIDLTKEYREKVDIYSLDKEIKIGFATNTFAVSGTPLENFDVNTTTGMVRYRPLNMTWLNLSSGGKLLDNNQFALTSNRTLSIWINLRDVATSSYIGGLDFGAGHLTLHNKYGLAQCSVPFLGVQTSTASSIHSTNVSLTANVWENVVVTVNSSNSLVNVYFNNVPVLNITPESSCSGFGFSDTAENRFGSTSIPLLGLLDSVRVYNVTLNSSEITSIYNNQRARNNNVLGDSNDANQVSYLSLDENSGLITFNKNNLADNGTILGTNPSWGNDGINLTTLGYPINISIQNITNALIFWDNYTLINNSETSNRTFTFLNNQSIYILENYKVNQSNLVTNSPISFSFSSNNVKNITNLLSNSVNVTVITNNSCQGIWNLTYKGELGTITNWLNANAKSVCSNLTSQGYTLQIDPATGSNQLLMDFDTTAPVITVTSPVAKQYKPDTSGTSIPIEFSATDDIQLDSLWYSIDGGVTNISYSTPVSQSISERKSYTWKFYANDTSGNQAVESVTFTLGCSDFEATGYRLMLIAGGLLLLGGVIFYLFRNGIIQNLTAGQLILLFIVIIVSIGLLIASADNIAVGCAL